jgi:NADH-quinone oxidoreductase subunit N
MQREKTVMAVERLLLHLAPEWVLFIGAFVVLLAPLSRGFSRGLGVSTLTLGIVLLALGATLIQGRPPDGTAGLGLWLTPLTFYTRCAALGVGAILVLVNWNQSVPGERGEYMALILLSLLGLVLTASANDLLVLLFAIELVSVPTYVLIALSQDDARAPEASVKYFFLGALAAAILAYGLTFWYGASGSTTLQVVSAGAGATTLPVAEGVDNYVLIGLLLIIGGLAFKVAAVPFHVYAPDVYEGAASPVTGLLGFVPKMAGFVALVKVLDTCHWKLPIEVSWLLWIIAAATMTVGNVTALLQTNVKRMLAYSSIAHTGYMLIALLVGPASGQGPMSDGIASLLFYITVYGVMNLGAFALLAAFGRGGRSVETLDDLAGLATHAPWPCLAFAVCVLSLMGLPPTAGFLGKVYIFGSAFSVSTDHAFHGPLFALAIIGVVNSAIGAAYYLRIVSACYVGKPATAAEGLGGRPIRWGLSACGLAMFLLFIWPRGLTQQARMAAASLNAVSRYASALAPSLPRSQISVTPRAAEP